MAKRTMPTTRRTPTAVQVEKAKAFIAGPRGPGPKPWPPFLKKALSEQQDRVWRLRNMIEAVNRAQEGGEVEDIEAALSGAVDYADRIHLDLDAGTLAQRAVALEAEDMS